MNENQRDSLEFNRRDFLRGGTVATLMTMMGGVELFAQTNAESAAAEKKPAGKKVKVGLIGLGPWGREILTTLAQVDQVEVAAICDNYAASLRRCAKDAPGAAQTDNYNTILENKDIKSVIVATPTHQHKEIVLAALKAGKHVYCEAPLANTVEDAREIAAAAKAAKHLVFQAGLQFRSDPQRHFLVPFIRSGALGQWVMAKAQWHKKTTWRLASPNPEREKAINWRLNRATSSGLVGELGCHQIDQAAWFINAQPVAVSGSGCIALHKEDGRDVPDTVQASFEFPNGVCLNYDATLANSFDASYEMFFGSDAAVMMRDGKAWMFKEVDSPLLGWEVYATKEVFYKETGIVLKAGTSKANKATTSNNGTDAKASASAAPTTPAPETPSTPLFFALQNFAKNSIDVSDRAEDMKESVGEVDPEELAKVPRRAAAGYLEGLQATVLAIKANEAILAGKRVELKREMYELA